VVGKGDGSDTVGLEIGEGDEPFLRLLRRTERSDSGVEGFASVLDEGLGLNIQQMK
jgi:hypothetical protein